MKLAVGTVVYQDAVGMKRLLDSCYQFVDYIFVIDGKYKDYDPDAIFPFSTDGLDDLVDRYHNVVFEMAENLTEWEKRTVYLDLCREYDITHLLIVDSDEYFHPDSNWKQFRQDIKNLKDYIYNLKNYTNIMGMIVPADQPRLWVNPCQLEYKNKHHYMCGLIGTDDILTANETLFSIKMIHDPKIRDEARTEKHDAYIHKLEDYERYIQLIETNKEKSTREYVVWNS